MNFSDIKIVTEECAKHYKAGYSHGRYMGFTLGVTIGVLSFVGWILLTL